MRQMNSLSQWPILRLRFAILGSCLGLLTLLLVGCSKPVLDKSLLTNDPCAPPCWNDLVPGESTEEDVRQKLENSSWVKRGSVKAMATEESNGKPSVHITWHGRKHRYTPNRAILQDDRLVRLEICIDYKLTFEEVVEQFGPPEGIHTRVTIKDNTLYGVWLDYPSQGLTFARWVLNPRGEIFPAEERGILLPGFLVTEVNYYVPNSLEGALRDSFLLPADVVEQRLQDEQAWEGFGEIKVTPRY